MLNYYARISSTYLRTVERGGGNKKVRQKADPINIFNLFLAWYVNIAHLSHKKSVTCVLT